MRRTTRISWLVVALGVLLAACGTGDDSEESEAPEDIIVEGESTTPTLATDATDPGSASSEDDDGVLEVATLLPLESGRFEADHWIKWKLGAPILDAAAQYTVTYQLNIRSAEDDVFGVGWTIQQGEEPFASGFCLDDRPNCDDGTVAVTVDLGPEGDELIFRIPEGTFGDATELEVGAFIQTFATSDAEVVTEHVTDGSRMPLGTDERDPC
jgi:hypothetical protein